MRERGAFRAVKCGRMKISKVHVLAIGVIFGLLALLLFQFRANQRSVDPYFGEEFGVLTTYEVQFVEQETMISKWQRERVWTAVQPGAVPPGNGYPPITEGIEIQLPWEELEREFSELEKANKVHTIIGAEIIVSDRGRVMRIEPDLLNTQEHSDIWPGGGLVWGPRRVLLIKKFLK